MNSRLNKVKGCLVVFWLSIFAMIIISMVEAHTPAITEYNTHQNVIVQDTIKKDTVIKPVEKLTKEQEKKMEYEEWQKRSQRMDENMKRMTEQSAVIDSLLGHPDTTKIVK